MTLIARFGIFGISIGKAIRTALLRVAGPGCDRHGKVISIEGRLIVAIVFIVSAAGCSSSIEAEFGGPYDFRGGDQKLADFTVYKHVNLTYSRPTVLECTLFQKSIDKNKKLFVYGDVLQVYNYVITTKGDIRVAIWRDNVGKLSRNDQLERAAGKVKVAQLGPDIMINFYPEIAYGDMKHEETLYWTLVTPTSKSVKKVGILDALSKHFLLAQSPNDISKAIAENFVEDWKDTKVAYAGEIVVVVNNNYYIINNNSGTYLPRGEDLNTVANYFDSTFEECKDQLPQLLFIQDTTPGKGWIRKFVPKGGRTS